MMRIQLCCLILLAAQSACQGKTDPFVLVRDGQPLATIVVSPDAPAIDRKAASVLQDYVRRISDAQLPIAETIPDAQATAILIGQAGAGTDGNGIGGEGYLIHSDANRLTIRGGSGKGVLYGVYTLIETYLGCRKLDQGPAWVPRSANVILPGDLHDHFTPPLVYRESFYPAALDNEYLDWHKLHRFEDLWGLWGHSYFKLVPPQDYFGGHPEYFALVGGRRQPTQLCLSNPAVERIAAENLKERMADAPAAEYWSIAPMDGGGFCTCDACSRADEEEGGHQGTLIRFVNRIAAQFPDKRFTTLAYTYTAHSPKKTKPASNVYVMLSSIDAQRHQPLATVPSAAAFRQQLADWRAMTDKLFVWDYTTQFTNYLAPFPDERNLQPNVAFMVNAGVTGIFEQGTGYTHGDLAELKSYLLAKALWHPDIDWSATQADFLHHYYGEASGPVSDYLEALHQAVAETGTVLDIYGNPVNNRTDYLSPERIDRYSALLDLAEAAAEPVALHADRVSRLRLGMEYTVLQQARLFGRDQHGFLVADADQGTLGIKPGWPQRVARFADAAERAGVTEFAEGGVDPAGYRAGWDALLANAWIPGITVDKPVALRHPFVPDYPAKKEATLTDGMAGDLDYSYNWLLFEQADLVATIDLGTPHALREVMLGFLDDPRHYLFAPTDVRVELSIDGQRYTPAGAVVPPSSTDQEARAQRRTVTIPSNASPVRYLRVIAVCPQRFPPWFTGSAKRKPVIAIDEITAR